MWFAFVDPLALPIPGVVNFLALTIYVLVKDVVLPIVRRNNRNSVESRIRDLEIRFSVHEGQAGVMRTDLERRLSVIEKRLEKPE